MTIQSNDVNVCSPGHNFVTLKIVTGDCVVGWGDAGLGVELDEGAASAFLYTAAYLPVNRRQDGTVHDW